MICVLSLRAFHTQQFCVISINSLNSVMNEWQTSVVYYGGVPTFFKWKEKVLLSVFCRND